MRLFLVDLLRCPVPHDETWLVASTGVMNDRHIIEGDLGCPICGARYRVRKGVAYLGDRAPGSEPLADADEGAATRLAALLKLESPEGVVLLARAHARHARLVRKLSGVEVLQLDPPADVAMGKGLSGIAGAPRAPLARNALRGAALDADTAGDEFVESVVRALRPSARLLAPVATPMPEGVSELARDDSQWVAEKRQAPARVIPLRRA